MVYLYPLKTTFISRDLRRPDKELSILGGQHQFAIRRIKFSPHADNLLASVSYDMSMKLHNIDSRTCVLSNDRHTEFVFGLDFSLFSPKILATCSWDELVDLVQIP